MVKKEKFTISNEDLPTTVKAIAAEESVRLVSIRDFENEITIEFPLSARAVKATRATLLAAVEILSGLKTIYAVTVYRNIKTIKASKLKSRKLFNSS